MSGHKQDDLHLQKKAAKKQPAVEAAPKKASTKASTEQAPPKPYGARVQEQKSAAKPKARYVSPEDVGVSAGPSQDDRGPMPPPPTVKLNKSISYRLISNSIEGGRLIVTIAAGSDQGVAEGDSGQLRTASGTPKHNFSVWDVKGRTCKATLEQATPDSIRALNAYFI